MMTRFAIAAVLLVSFLVGFEPDLTGNAIHEWLNLALGATIVVHLVADWDWLAAVLRRPVGQASGSLRVKIAVDVLLAVTFVLLLVSGLMISQSVLGRGTSAPRHSLWNELHSACANIALLLIGVHVALNWAWIERQALSLVRPQRPGAPSDAPVPAAAGGGRRVSVLELSRRVVVIVAVLCAAGGGVCLATLGGQWAVRTAGVSDPGGDRLSGGRGFGPPRGFPRDEDGRFERRGHGGRGPGGDLGRGLAGIGGSLLTMALTTVAVNWIGARRRARAGRS